MVSIRQTGLVLGLVGALAWTQGSAATGDGKPGPSASGDDCPTSREKWKSTRIAEQEETFRVEFDAVPGKSPMNGITGLSFGPAREFDDLAASVRFSPDGVIDSRNGDEFEARVRIAYRAGARYHVRMVIRMRQRTYDVYVTPPGGAEQALALSHGFRTEQEDLDSLNHWALFARKGSHEVCGFSVSPAEEAALPPPAEEPPPPAEEKVPEVLPTPPTGAAVLVGAGDIGNCRTSTDEATANLLDRIEGTIFTVGDNAYPDGSAKDFARCFDPSWGRHKHRMRPVPGNHDYNTPGAKGYFDYFGSRAGPPGRGYYSYNLGAWHIVALNSNIDMKSTSRQVAWLRQDLAAHPAKCTLAYWHHPTFSSGKHGDNPKTKELWNVLYEAGAEVVLVGHDHAYERFAPQTPDGKVDTRRGIRQFVVGMGGTKLRRIEDRAANTEASNHDTHGLLKLTLAPDSYRWEFIPVEGKGFKDEGTGRCH